MDKTPITGPGTAGFTPGPWTLETTSKASRMDGVPGNWHEITSPLYADALAEVYEPDDTNVDEALANARLIAAAPELLEALEELVRWHQLCHPDTAPAFSEARAAIAKARQ